MKSNNILLQIVPCQFDRVFRDALASDAHKDDPGDEQDRHQDRRKPALPPVFYLWPVCRGKQRLGRHGAVRGRRRDGDNHDYLDYSCGALSSRVSLSSFRRLPNNSWHGMNLNTFMHTMLVIHTLSCEYPPSATCYQA
mgnify:CR=1 FL=1|jgi:hypothetical protein